eukprot:9000-Eustigmatos_ZCMA.PRE.1
MLTETAVTRIHVAVHCTRHMYLTSAHMLTLATHIEESGSPRDLSAIDECAWNVACAQASAKKMEPDS